MKKLVLVITIIVLLLLYFSCLKKVNPLSPEASDDLGTAFFITIAQKFLSTNEITISYPGATHDLSTNLVDDVKDVSWSSSDESVATVNSAGVVEGVWAGSAIIYVFPKDADTNTATECTVTVEDIDVFGSWTYSTASGSWTSEYTWEFATNRFIYTRVTYNNNVKNSKAVSTYKLNNYKNGSSAHINEAVLILETMVSTSYDSAGNITSTSTTTYDSTDNRYLRFQWKELAANSGGYRQVTFYNSSTYKTEADMRTESTNDYSSTDLTRTEK